MKIQSKKMSKTPLLITAAAATLLAVSALTYVYAFNGSILGWNNHAKSSNKMPLTNLDTPTNEQIKAGNDIKKENSDKSSGGKSTPSAPASQPGSSKQNVEVMITVAKQYSDSGTLRVRTQISRVVNTGQCTINLTKSGKTVTKTADVQALANTSTCKGFDIPVSELSAGSWSTTLTYENDSLLGTTSTVIEIQ